MASYYKQWDFALLLALSGGWPGAGRWGRAEPGIYCGFGQRHQRGGHSAEDGDKFLRSHRQPTDHLPEPGWAFPVRHAASVGPRHGPGGQNRADLLYSKRSRPAVTAGIRPWQQYA